MLTMKQIYKLYAVVEPEMGIFYIPWFKNTGTLMMDGDEEVKEGHPWLEIAKWAKENRETARSFDFYHDEDMDKILAAFNVKRPESWEDLTSRAGVE
jgi:hypothetical protein